MSAVLTLCSSAADAVSRDVTCVCRSRAQRDRAATVWNGDGIDSRNNSSGR